MIVVSIIAVLLLLFSIFRGLREGAVKPLFTLLATLIAVPVAGVSYQTLAGWLSFIPGGNWENFVAFFIMMAVASIIMYFVFLLPGRALQKTWPGGLFFCILGIIFHLVNTAIGMVVFALVLHAYPIFDWLERAVSGSAIIAFLVSLFSFVQAVLPEALRQAAVMVQYFLV
jgi:uncharacterized membrane protein required for colicin V production